MRTNWMSRAILVAVTAPLLTILLAPTTANAHYRPRYYRYYGAYRPYGYFYRPYYWGWYSPWYSGYPYSVYGPDYSVWHGAVRLEAKPVETQVYVDGYYAGVVDDFDGIFQRLYLRPGKHDLELRLRGHRTFREPLLIRSGHTYKIHHRMEPLRPGEPEEPAPEPRRREEVERDYPEPEPREVPEVEEPPPTARPSEEQRPPERIARFGTLTLRVQPEDAEVWIDGERWGRLAGMDEVVLHLPAGRRRIQVNREGYQAFEAELTIRPGEDQPLNVKLAR